MIEVVHVQEVQTTAAHAFDVMIRHNVETIVKYENTYKYTYEGPDDKNKNLAKIKVETTLNYEPPAEGAEGLPFRIKDAKLTSKDAKGTIWFDTQKGRLEKSEHSLNLEGTLDIEIGGMQTKVELKQTQSTTVNTSDTPQIKKPA